MLYTAMDYQKVRSNIVIALNVANMNNKTTDMNVLLLLFHVVFYHYFWN